MSYLTKMRGDLTHLPVVIPEHCINKISEASVNPAIAKWLAVI